MIWRTSVRWKGVQVFICKIVFMIGVTALAFGGLSPIDPFALAQDKDMALDPDDPKGSMDFKACVRLAFERSPYFKQSALEIDVRRLDESDSRWSFVPSVTMRTNTYLALDEGGGTTLTFGVDEYDPLMSYFSLKVSKILTEIAVFMHQKVISEGISDLARKLLESHALAQIALCHDKTIAHFHEKLAYIRERHKAGAATPVEVQLVEQQLAIARAESKYITARQSAIREGLNQFFDLEPSRRLDLDLHETRLQILDPLNPAATRLEQARDHSFDLRIQELKKELQAYRISLAYAKFIPKVSAGMRETDDLDSLNQDEYYFNLGVRFNLWNGFKDVNDVSRQKMILKKVKNETRLAEVRLDTEWQNSQRAFVETETAMKLARMKVEMAELKERQSEIHYSATRHTMSQLLDHRIDSLKARKESLRKVSDHDLSILRIRHLSGDLFTGFLRVTPGQE